MNLPLPELAHDAMMRKRFGQTVSPQGRLERRIVWNLLAKLEAAGFTSFRVDDGEDVSEWGKPKAAMELIFNLDDAYLHVHKASSPIHWVRLVLGNGFDVISDYGTPLVVQDGFPEVMDAFNAEDYA